MALKDLARSVPGLRHVLMMRYRLKFGDSQSYWESRYARGGTSGAGSYGHEATGKAEFLNELVATRGVTSVIEFGCGDGNQLSLAKYPRYIGLDVSRTAVKMCAQRFASDPTKSFYLYDSACFADDARLFTADLAMSLDVIQHLTEQETFEAYMRHVFAAGTRFVVIYGSNVTNSELGEKAPHVRNHVFSSWVDENCPGWKLAEVVTGPRPEPNNKDFFVYERAEATELSQPTASAR